MRKFESIDESLKSINHKAPELGDPELVFFDPGKIASERLKLVRPHIDLARELRVYAAEVGDREAFVELHSALWSVDVMAHGAGLGDFSLQADRLIVTVADYAGEFLYLRTERRLSPDPKDTVRMIWSLLVNGLVPDKLLQRALDNPYLEAHEIPRASELVMVTNDGDEASGRFAPRFA